MLRILRQRLKVHLDARQAYEFQKKLRATLTPLIASVRREYIERLGLAGQAAEDWLQREQEKQKSPLLCGDLFLKDGNTFLYYRVPRDEQYLEAGVVTRGNPTEYEVYFKEVQSCLGTAAQWERIGADASLEGAIAAESTVVSPTGGEVEASRELESDSAQKLMAQVVSAGSVFFNKLSADQDRGGLERLTARFENLGVVTRDFAVLCRKTGQQILRVSSRTAIEDPAQKSFKCFICGNSISEESLDEIITVTDFGRKLLEKDYWLVVRVLGALESAGVANHDVRIHFAEGVLTNFFVTINDQMYLIVVTNRKITLEESYLINAHVAAYKVSNVIVVCTDKISVLMRHHLEKSNPGCGFDFLDTLSNLESSLENIFARKEKAILKGVLEHFSDLTPVAVEDLVMQRISPDPTAPVSDLPKPSLPSNLLPPAMPAQPALVPDGGRLSDEGSHVAPPK